ncbi:uncharacterized protein LAESUDRAFT_668161, partial [Laetiporus sulphureus 93-53]
MEAKISLPAFLKMLTNHNVPATKAMAVAGNIYKTYNTPSALAQLNDFQLKASGVDEKDLRKLVLAAIRKSGFRAKLQASSSSAHDSTPNAAGSSTSFAQAERPKKKRKRDDDLNEFLPDRLQDEGEQYGSLEFDEVLDEEVLQTKYTVVNRAPIMMAWAFVVAERLGFQRQEALSIASVYTEMNAITKGVSRGIFDKDKGKGVEASMNGSQPYVDLMGRRPLYQTASGSWRALSSSVPVAPTSPFSYIKRSLRQTAPHVLGALRLLAASYTPAELNRKGYALYADLRPDVDGWGKRGDVRCSTILGLRNVGGLTADVKKKLSDGVQDLVKVEPVSEDKLGAQVNLPAPEVEDRPSKKQNSMSLEEYEAALDADHTFDDVDLNFD